MTRQIILAHILSSFWWYRTVSHAAELIALFYNQIEMDTLQFSECSRRQASRNSLTGLFWAVEFTFEEKDEAFADPEGLS